MLQNFLYFLIISAFCLLWGLPVLQLFTKKIDRNYQINGEKIIFSFFIGLIIISFISAWISLFTGVRFYLLALISLPWIIIWKSFFQKLSITLNKDYTLNKLDHLLIASVILLFFTLSAGMPVMEDTDLYHVQTIKWLHDYGTVPGLANLYLRFGFYSNWFRLISIFQLPFPHQNFLYLNNTFCIWFFFFLFHQYKTYSYLPNTTLARHFRLFYFLLLAYALFEWDLFRIASISTSYDFVVTAYTLISLHILLQLLFKKNIPQEFHYCLMLFLVALPFLKISGFLAGFLALTYILIAKPNLKKVVFAFIVGLAGLIPFLTANYIQTGYLFYPYTLFTFSKPEWQVPLSMVQQFNKYILLQNLYINIGPPPEAMLDNSSFSYVHNWFLHLTKPDQFLFSLSVVALPIAPFAFKKLYPGFYSKILLILSACYIMILLWLIFSPEPRFSFATLLFTSLFTIAALFSGVIRSWTYKAAWTATALVVLAYTGIKWINKDFNVEQILHTKSIPVPPNNILTINNVPFHIPLKIQNNWNQRCYNSPLPCIYEINPWLQPRGRELKSGFKMFASPDQVFVENYYY